MSEWGVYRVYFNCIEDQPWVWSVDRGDVSSECYYKGVKFLDVVAETKWQDHIDRKSNPNAWIELEEEHVECELRSGFAYFYPRDHYEDYKELIYG